MVQQIRVLVQFLLGDFEGAMNPSGSRSQLFGNTFPDNSNCSELYIAKKAFGTLDEFVSGQWDMFNTFSDLVGSSKRSSDGISLVPELFENPQQAHPYLYFEYPEKQGQLAIRVGDWKGVKTGLKTNVFTPWQLYHLKNDPSESNEGPARPN